MLEDGDVVTFDYDLYVEGRPEVFDTTQKATAEAAGLLDPNAFYAPMTYLFGTGRIIKGLENALRGAEVGKTQTIELDVADAYGPRDPKLIETIPIHEFKRNKIDPEVGLAITYKNRRGVVQFVGGGRIRVDFNHALAGKRLRYVVTLRSIAKTLEEKVRGVVTMDYPTKLDWSIGVEKGVATINVPDEAKFDQNFLVAKYRILSDLRKIPHLESVRIVEGFPLKEKEEARTLPAA